jgi:hypothetical protein
MRTLTLLLTLLSFSLRAQTVVLSPQQPRNANLTSISALTTTSFGLSLLEAANSSALQALVGSIAPAYLGTGTASSSTYLRGDGTWSTPASSASNSLLLAGGSGSNLAGLTAATAATGGLIYGTQSGADRKFTLTAAGAALAEAANAAVQLTAMGAASLGANTFTGNQTITGAVIVSSSSTFGSASGDYLSVRASSTQEFRLASNFLGLGPSAYGLGSYLSGSLLPASAVTIFVEGQVAARGGVYTYGNITWSTGLVLVGVSASTLQLGFNDATTPTAQTIKGMDVTTGTGGAIWIAGGKGSVAGGSTVLASPDTNGSPVARLTADKTGVTVGNIILYPIPSTAPGSNPPTNFFYLYVDPSDHTLRSRGPSGTITILANP